MQKKKVDKNFKLIYNLTIRAKAQFLTGGYMNMRPYGDEQYEENYTLLNFFQDLFSRLNILFEYITTVFFPNFPKD